MPAWPATLPQHLQEAGYRESLGKQSIETPMDTGPAKIRRRTTRMPRMINGTIAMTSAQATLFEAFYETDCAGGSLTFTWVHPRTRAPATLRFRDPPPAGVSAPGQAGEVMVYTVRLEVMS